MRAGAGDPLEHDPSAGAVTAGRTERQQAVAALITQTVIMKAIDFGGDVAAVHAQTIGYRTINALREHGPIITRKR